MLYPSATLTGTTEPALGAFAFLAGLRSSASNLSVDTLLVNSLDVTRTSDADITVAKNFFDGEVIDAECSEVSGQTTAERTAIRTRVGVQPVDRDEL